MVWYGRAGRAGPRSVVGQVRRAEIITDGNHISLLPPRASSGPDCQIEFMYLAIHRYRSILLHKDAGWVKLALYAGSGAPLLSTSKSAPHFEGE